MDRATHARRDSEDFAVSQAPFEAAADPAPTDQYEALRVAWTPVMLASKLRTAAAEKRERRFSAELPEPGSVASLESSPSKSPNPIDRVRSHHRERPALIAQGLSARLLFGMLLVTLQFYFFTTVREALGVSKSDITLVWDALAPLRS